MKRLLLVAALLLIGTHAHAQTSEAEVQADLLSIQIVSTVEAGRLTDAAKLFDEYVSLGVTMPPPLILQRAVVYFKLERFVDAEVQLKNYLKKSKRGSEEYNRAVLMLAEVKPKAETEAEAKRVVAEAKAKAAAKVKAAAEAKRAAAAKAKAAAEAKLSAEAEAKRVAAAEKAAAQRLGKSFRDCPDCPEMVVVRAGSFMMGSPASEEGRSRFEGPRQHQVTVGEYAVGKYEVTFDEWEAYRRDKKHVYDPDDEGWGKGKRPVINVSWKDAKRYVKWLSKKTGKRYRLLSESEWEDAARAMTMTPFYTGQTISPDQANYGDNHGKTLPAGSFPANYFGLHDMHGNVDEWVEDCWHGNYVGAPSNGSAWTKGGSCAVRVLRGGSWNDRPRYLRAANRFWNDTADRSNDVGFRVARTLTP